MADGSSSSWKCAAARSPACGRTASTKSSPNSGKAEWRAVGPDGAMYVCNMATPGLDARRAASAERTARGLRRRLDPARRSQTGKFLDALRRLRRQTAHSPNDIVFDSQGGFWFTCLGQTDGEVRRLGAVYHARPDGKKIVRWRSGSSHRTALAFRPMSRVVYMADCIKGQLLAFDLSAPGTMLPAESLAGGRVIATLPGFQMARQPCRGSERIICVATIWKAGSRPSEPNGNYEHFPAPDAVRRNIVFGGADMRDAWITCSSTGSSYQFRWPRRD